METITQYLDEVRAFHAVATAGSFTKAASTLKTSKANLSKQVLRLESALHVKLLHRTTRALALTAEGEALLVYSRRIVRAADRAGRRLRLMKEGESGTLRISAPISFGGYLFPSLLPALREALPGIEVDFDLSNSNRDINKGAFDFAFRAAKVEDPDLIARPLGSFRDSICASPKFLEKTGPIHARDLGALSCLLHSKFSGWNRWNLVSEKSGELNLEVTGGISVNHFSLMREFCLQGAGIAKLPRYVVAKDIAAGRLIEPFEEYSSATHPVYLVYSREEFASAKQRLAKKVLLEWVGAHRDIFVE